MLSWTEWGRREEEEVLALLLQDAWLASAEAIHTQRNETTKDRDATKKPKGWRNIPVVSVQLACSQQQRPEGAHAWKDDLLREYLDSPFIGGTHEHTDMYVRRTPCSRDKQCIAHAHGRSDSQMQVPGDLRK